MGCSTATIIDVNVPYYIPPVPNPLPPLPSFPFSIGKGLSGSGGVTNFFGASCASPPQFNTNQPPQIVTPTTLFDVTGLPQNTIQCFVMDMVSWYGDVVTAALAVEFMWYRKRDNALLADVIYNVPSPQSQGYGWWNWYYVYDYFCNFTEDGYYSCVIDDLVHPTTTIEFFVHGTGA